MSKRGSGVIITFNNFKIYFILFLLHICVFVYACVLPVYMQMTAVLIEPTSLIPMELELQVVASSLMRMLGTDLRFFERAVCSAMSRRHYNSTHIDTDHSVWRMISPWLLLNALVPGFYLEFPP